MSAVSFRTGPWVLGLVIALGALPREAEAGLGCTDVCGPPSPAGDTCGSLGLGCNPFTRVCARCEGPAADAFCQPGGTCMPDGTCANVMCGGGAVDAGRADAAGADAGDVGLMDAGTSSTATVADAGPGPDGGDPFDAGGTSTVADAGPIDTGIPPENPARIRSRATDDKPLYDDGNCTCTQPRRGGWAFGGWGLLAGLALYRRRASMGPTRRSAKSSV